jgi:hypothetical protein
MKINKPSLFISRTFLRALATTVLFSVVLVANSHAKILKTVADSLEGTQLSTQDGRISLVETPRRAGTHAFKHVITNTTERAEIGKLTNGRADNGGTYWYGFSFMHMSDPPIPSGKFTILMQMYQGHRDASLWPCGGGGHKLTVAPDRNLQYHLQYEGGGGSIKCQRFNLYSFDQIKDKWVDYVIHVKWTQQTNGFLKLWMRIGGDSANWEQKIDYTGATIASGDAPYTKMGPYVGNPKNGSRLVYTDEYRWADADSTFEDVAPGGKSSEPPTSITVDLSLTTGWNLVSLPVNPVDGNISALMSSVVGKFLAVYAYDNANGQYRSYIPGAASNNLTTLEVGRGYWVYMNEAVKLSVKGTPAAKSIPLGVGWNLAGFNSRSAMPVSGAFASIQGKFDAVYGYDNGSGQYKAYAPPTINDLSSLKPGEGYWIHTKENITWTLP